MTEINQELYQQLILEHNRKPRNFRKLAEPTHFAEGFNPLCGDRYEVYLKVNADGIIEDVSFEGSGCAISKASASLMTEGVKGKPVAQAQSLFAEFRELLKGTDPTLAASPTLGKLRIFAGIWKYPSRVKCAGLSWHAMHAAVEDKNQVSTE